MLGIVRTAGYHQEGFLIDSIYCGMRGKVALSLLLKKKSVDFPPDTQEGEDSMAKRRISVDIIFP